MRPRDIAATVVGVLLALLGLLWLLQGAGVLRLCPLLCFVDCACLTGESEFWEVTGALAFILGIMVVGVSVRQAAEPKKPS